MNVNEQRLWTRLEALGEIGRDPHTQGGVTRPSFSPAHRQALLQVARWGREAGLEVARDASGTLILRLPGRDPEAAAVALGSHLDSVPQGGRFDGALGVLAALEVLQTLREANVVPPRPLVALGFADEEGNRFGVGVLSAQLWTGEIAGEGLERLHDAEGRSLAAHLRDLEADVQLAEVPLAERPALAGYLELHVEQGPVMASSGAQVAAVEAIVGISRSTLTFEGQANHAGTTPMELRQDALIGAAELALAVREAARARAGRAVATVGVFEVEPGATNVIPGRVRLRVELRAPTDGILSELRAEVEAAARAAAERGALALSIEPWHLAPAVAMHESARRATEAALADAGLPPLTLPSWAGHDAKVMARHMPAGMLFVPSVGGLSHTPDEFTASGDCAAGAQALLHAALRLAEALPSGVDRGRIG